MMPRALFLAFVAACAHSPRPAAPAPRPPLDLSGEWISGSGAGPAGPVVNVTRPCGQTVTHWRFTHAAAHVSAILIQGTPLTGTPHDLPVAAWMSGSADTSGVELVAGAPGRPVKRTAYRLRYDTTTRRLRGTHDGDSVWFAPLHVDEPRGCQDANTVAAQFDLSGSWSTGQGTAEPAAALVTLHPDCRDNPAAWALQQTAHTVEAWSFPETFSQGTAPKDPPRVNIPAHGRISGLDVTIQDAASIYHLRYDPESGHLRGTRNGVPFWAVRQVVTRPGPCLPVP